MYGEYSHQKKEIIIHGRLLHYGIYKIHILNIETQVIYK